ncbi:MAG: hypothetical protein ABSG99_02775 [Sedimentisphaerales bacterium]
MQLAGHFNTSAFLRSEPLYKEYRRKTGYLTLPTVEIAQKQRHLHLLEKVRSNKALSPAELKELKRYEEMMGKKGTQNTERRRRGVGGRFVKTADHRPQTTDEFAALAAELKSVAALDSQFDEHFDLDKHPRVKAALEQAVSARVEDIIRQRFAGLGAKKTHKDYRRVTFDQLAEIAGVKRRTVYFWIDNKGLKREDDGSFWLPTFFGWFEEYTKGKVLERLPDRQMNPYQAGRAKELAMHIAKEEHQLLDRTEVMAGQVARHQNLINSFTHKAEELAMEAHGQPEAVIAKMLGDFFDEVLRQQCQVGEQLHLPEEKAKQFGELLRNL